MNKRRDPLVKLDLSGLEVNIELLYHTGSSNFYGEAGFEGRFEPINGKPITGGGFMYWCESYVAALLLAKALEVKYGAKTSILIDDAMPSDSAFAVQSTKNAPDIEKMITHNGGLPKRGGKK